MDGWTFQSTLPAGGATVCAYQHPRVGWNFKPRSPRGERLLPMVPNQSIRDISIHAPRGGSDANPGNQPEWAGNFNPRSPRGERLGLCRTFRRMRKYFNPRSPRGERPTPVPILSQATKISIHAPRGGSDVAFWKFSLASLSISIHAPRGGSDYLIALNHPQSQRYFNPRSPRGERPILSLR